MKTVVLFLVFPFLLFAQVSNVKINHNVYNYLSKLSQKGIIEYNDLVKPLSRRYVASKLVEAEKNNNKLTTLQKDELKFYIAEFGYEIEKIKKSDFRIQNLEFGKNDEELRNKTEDQSTKNIAEDTKQRDLLDKSWEFEVRNTRNEQNNNLSTQKYTFIKQDKYERWRIFNYTNNLMNLNVNPILGYESANWEGFEYSNSLVGLSFSGEIGDILGFNFEFINFKESPSVKNYLYNEFSRNTSFNVQLTDYLGLEHNKINVDLGTSWDWGSFTIGKNHLNWGYAENGKIVLSEKAPSFPYLRLDIKPANWVSFNYIHAWLNSDVVDTSSFHSSWRVRDQRTDKFSNIQKFLAMHSFIFTPWQGFDISIGESVIYSGNLEPVYLIPIMFFDIADHYLSGEDNYLGSSTQLFLSASSRNHIPNTHLYGSFHADELTPDGLFDPAKQYYKFAFTFGGYVIDLPINNIGLRLEYTKIYPGNYRHFIPSLTYESSSTIMGHWMGDNGDLVYAALDYTVIRGLKIKLWTQYIRKGTEALGNRAYKIQIPQPHFLFTDNIGDRKNYTYYGIDVEYEYLHDLWIKVNYQYIDYEKRYEVGKFSSALYRDLSITLGYGI